LPLISKVNQNNYFLIIAALSAISFISMGNHVFAQNSVNEQSIHL